MRLAVEVEGEGEAAALPGDGAALVAFMSFAEVCGFGARHPLIALAERAAALGVRLAPLAAFYEREAADAEDEAMLERAWQEAAPLAATLAALAEAIRTDDMAQTLIRRAEAGTLPAEADALRAIAERAARANRRVRLTYEL